MTRVTTDVDVLNELFTAGVVTLLGDLLVLLGVVALLFVLNTTLALVAFSVIPLLFLITIVFKIKARDSYRRVRTAIARINAFLQEQISGMSIVQLFNHEQKSFQRFEQINRVHLKANLDSVMAYSLLSGRGSRQCPGDRLDHLVRGRAGAPKGTDVWCAGCVHSVLREVFPADRRPQRKVQHIAVGNGELGKNLQVAGHARGYPPAGEPAAVSRDSRRN
jgi:ABC-type multidrug transport system fused ATPase/permease subunit